MLVRRSAAPPRGRERRGATRRGRSRERRRPLAHAHDAPCTAPAGDPPVSSGALRRAGLAAATVLISVALCVAAGELLLRAAGRGPLAFRGAADAPPFYQPHPSLGWEHVPGRFRVGGAPATFLPDGSRRAAAAPPPPGPAAPAAGAATPAQSAAIPAPSGAILPPGTPEDQYKFAIGLVRQRAFGDAERAFREFLAIHGKDDLAPNAQYWLGETLYVRQMYDEAARAFLTVYQDYPNSDKATDSLLKLGITLTHLGQRNEACATFAELLRRLPTDERRLRPKAELERRNAGCS